MRVALVDVALAQRDVAVVLLVHVDVLDAAVLEQRRERPLAARDLVHVPVRHARAQRGLPSG